MTSAKRCFVVMGFGIKTDFATGRKLDLDKSYRLLIKPVAEEKGLVCVRADEIRHSGTIDVPMYEQLLTADIVIADLSTANPNALYELGIRHALRPRTTIVISENKLSYPFDLNHVVITSYTHLGEAIDYDEVTRFRKVLGDTIVAVLLYVRSDSEIYTFLSRLTPPSLGAQAAEAVAQAGQALKDAGEAIAERGLPRLPVEPGLQDTLAMTIEQGEDAIAHGRFGEAKRLFSLATRFSTAEPKGAPVRHDPYLVQRLVLSTYKAKEPDERQSLNEAMLRLSSLNPKESNDPEVVGLAGAIEKRLFDQGEGIDHLNRAIRFYERGYHLRSDRHNGINLAYVLNMRAGSPLDTTNEERIADVVTANRIRADVLDLCAEELNGIRDRERRAATAPDPIRAAQAARDREQKFWCLATQAEALLGLGRLDAFEAARLETRAMQSPAWMMESFEQQVDRLRKLLESQAHLLNPAWPGRPPESGARQTS